MSFTPLPQSFLSFRPPQMFSPSPKLCATMLHDGNLPGPDVVQADQL